MLRWRPLLLASALALGASACGPDVNLTKTLEVKVTESGYFDAGLMDGKTHLLPSLTFELRNSGDTPIASVVLLVSFYQQGADGEFDSIQATGIGSAGVVPGNSSLPILARAPHGYTLEGARADFFTNPVYKDMFVKVFAKKRANYMPLGEFKIDRRVLEPSGKTPGAQ
jgi:hypothetical protein